MRPQPLTLLVLLAVLTGCSATGSSSSDSSGSAKSASAPGTSSAPVASVALVEARRAVVRTAVIAVTVDDAAASADAAVLLARTVGGLVESDRRSQDGPGGASLVLRVPPRTVERTLADLSRLGEETSRDVGDKDVTEQSVDLASRLATQRASVERVRALLARATNLGEITSIEAQLTRRQADLDSLQSRVDALAQQVDLATVTVQVTGRGARAAASSDPGFLDGLGGGWDALVGTTRIASLVAGAVLPFLPLLLIALLGRVLWRRRRIPAPTT